MSNELYTDEQLLAATGLHIDNVRKLVTWGAVRPVKGGRGRGNVRMWGSHTVRRIACVAALVNSGLSVRMAHTLAYLDILGDLSIEIIDPDTLAMNAGDRDGWFDPSRPLNPSNDLDFKLIVADGRYVFSGSFSEDEPLPKGILTDNGSVFRTPVDFSRLRGSSNADGTPPDLRPFWETVPGYSEIDPASLAWKHDESVGDLSDMEWQHAFRNAVSLTTVNLSLACKIAMRRLLGIPVFFPDPPLKDERGDTGSS